MVKLSAIPGAHERRRREGACNYGTVRILIDDVFPVLRHRHAPRAHTTIRAGVIAHIEADSLHLETLPARKETDRVASWHNLVISTSIDASWLG